MKAELRIKGGSLWAGNESYWLDGVVDISGDEVIFAGAALDAPDTRPDRVLDAGGGLIMPGLINAHCHGPMVLFRGMADDMPLDKWLNEAVFPAEAAHVNPEMAGLCSRLAAAEMLLSGTTTVGDSYFCMDGAVPAYVDAGMRAVLAQGVIDFPAPGVPDPGMALEVAAEFVRRWQGDNPLITPGIFAHAPYTCSPETFKGAADLARELGAPFFTHLAETQAEPGMIQERHGKPPALYLEELGVLEDLTSCAHGVWLSPEELAALSGAGVALVHCPESNMKLANGVAQVVEWQQAGITAALGTDGAASNNDLCMFGEMRSAALMAKVSANNPAALPAAQVLEMATTGSARALGMGGRLGRLKPGYLADLIVVDLKQPHHTPWYQAASALVYAGSGADVKHVVVGGVPVVAFGELLTLDLPVISTQVANLAANVANLK
jgi:5-methylthioadenosine/S-adenosylhomocysteine deaminase